ncbi:hypothetical protein HQ865_21350 [Mucilaginibacter mali]|uniref:Uncharacterized protein n=1 Tax=Mucilaginibacter mali TaxID=2740462 RepID=A0A7D4UQ79_9SPHI|nr:hypothetical protein [Mucilaginibacter mali]QKJ32200.1 hypothetical protein HQ865_21350 [Mucilaginibacter mali]
MKPIYANTLKFAFAIIAAITFFIVSNLNAEKEKHQRLLALGDLRLSGKVIDSSVYKYGGRPYLLICLKLDTCNKKSLYLFNDLIALKIKNGIATMSAGPDYTIAPISFVAIDAKRNIMITRYQNGQADTSDIDIRADGLTESQMNFCNKDK